RAVGHGDGAAHGADGRADHVLAIVLVRARDVAGDGETRQAGDGDVGRATDAKLVHAAAPHRNPPGVAIVVDPPGLQKPAQAADFDVDDAPATQLQRLARVLRRVDAFVQAD